MGASGGPLHMDLHEKQELTETVAPALLAST